MNERKLSLKLTRQLLEDTKELRLRCYWEDMKTDIQKHIRNCCQLSKLKRAKTKLPMQITDTPENAFD